MKKRFVSLCLAGLIMVAPASAVFTDISDSRVSQTAAVLEAGALQSRALLLQVVLFYPQLLAVVASKGDLQRFCCVLTLHATRRLSA